MIRRGDAFTRKAYRAHGAGIVLALGFAVGVAGVPVPLYLGAAYAGYALLMLRTFAEHRAAEAVGERTAIVEAEGPLALAFLNNNLHAVHHRAPSLPWHELPARWRAERGEVLRDNHAYHFPGGYTDVVRRWLLRRREPIVHPLSGEDGTV